MKFNKIVLVALFVFLGLFVVCQCTMAGFFLVLMRLPVMWGMIVLVVVIVVAYVVPSSYEKFNVIVCLALFVMFVPINFMTWSFRNADQKKRMDRIIESISEMPHPPKSLRSAGVLAFEYGVFGLDEIKYVKYGDYYEITSYGIPVGPFSTYSSKTKEWSSHK